MNQGYKLYRDGQFFDLTHDADERSPLAQKAIAGDAAAAHKLLQSALEKYRDVRPARLASESQAKQNPSKNAKE